MKQILAICGIVCLVPLLGQSTFNMLYDNEQRTELAYFSVENIVELRYLVTASSFKGSYDAIQVLKLSSNGDIVDSLIMVDSSQHWYPENITIVNDSSYAITGTQYDLSSGATQMFISKITENLDTNWFRVYSKGSLLRGSKKLKTTMDGGLLLAGFVQIPPDNKGQVYLLKVDNFGNEKWELELGDTSLSETAYDFTQLSDSSYIVISRRSTSSDDNVLIHKISSTGKVKWEKELISSRLTIANVCLPISGTRMLMGGISRLTVNGKSNAYVAMIDTSGDLKWEKYYGGSESGWFADGAVLDSEHVVFAGNQSGIETYQGNRDGYVVKMDTSGNVVWSRIVNPMGEFEHDYDDYFYGLLATSDGGILGTGFTGKGHISNTQDAWIMKLDSEGLCDTPTCYPWLVTVLPNPERAEVKVWPNPATDHLQLLLTAPAGVISLYNLQGVRLLEQTVHSRRSQLQLSNLPAGLYLLNWTVDGKVRETRKVVIQR